MNFTTTTQEDIMSYEDYFTRRTAEQLAEWEAQREEDARLDQEMLEGDGELREQNEAYADTDQYGDPR